MLGALLYVFCHVRALSQGERIALLRRDREDLIRKQEKLQVGAASLQIVGRIRQIAANELGMRFPDERPNNLYKGPRHSRLRAEPTSLNVFTVSDAGR